MKLLKCLVDNIVVDISFDMLGGISTVCFLESIDRFIRKEHLFKRSIILVSSLNLLHARLACYTCIPSDPFKIPHDTHTQSCTCILWKSITWYQCECRLLSELCIAVPRSVHD